MMIMLIVCHLHRADLSKIPDIIEQLSACYSLLSSMRPALIFAHEGGFVRLAVTDLSSERRQFEEQVTSSR